MGKTGNPGMITRPSRRHIEQPEFLFLSLVLLTKKDSFEFKKTNIYTSVQILHSFPDNKCNCFRQLFGLCFIEYFALDLTPLTPAKIFNCFLEAFIPLLPKPVIIFSPVNISSHGKSSIAESETAVIF